MYRGTKAPILIWNRGEFDGDVIRVNLPAPINGGRSESFEPLTEFLENIDGGLVTEESPSWRFLGEYEFAKIDTEIIDTLFAINNNTSTVKWIPHADFPMINYSCIIEELSPEPLAGRIIQDTIKIKLKGVTPVYKRPTADNMIGAVMLTRISVK